MEIEIVDVKMKPLGWRMRWAMLAGLARVLGIAIQPDRRTEGESSTGGEFAGRW